MRMACLFALFGGLFPRLALLVLWIARPALVGAAFNTFLLPLLGIIFLPFATLIYVIVYTPGVGLIGFDWFWVDSRRPARHRSLDGQLHPTQPDPRGKVNAGNHSRDLPGQGGGSNSVTRRTTDGGER
jgi:hypothetical protein